jgi:hypothetical protein
MVRYREIIQENNLNNIKYLEELASIHRKEFDVWAPFVVNPDTLRVDCDGDIIMNNLGKGKISIPFGVVSGEFNCAAMRLISLENSPTFVGGHFCCNGNALKSLEYAPTQVEGDFKCYNVDLTSLKGIEFDSIIKGDIVMDYNENLPLLRLCIGKGNVVTRRNEIPGVIITQHIKQYPNIKERIIKCQYDLIKSGFKNNAKW